MPVPSTVPHKHPLGRDAAVSKTPTSLEDFPPDVQEVVYQLLAKAIMRSAANETYVPPPEAQQPDNA